MKNKHIITVIVTVLFSISAYSDNNQSTSLQALSAWTNQSGSTFYIDTIGSNGLLTGTYIKPGTRIWLPKYILPCYWLGVWYSHNI